MNIISADVGFGNLKVWNGSGGTIVASHAAIARGGNRYEDVYDEDGDEVQLIEFGDTQIYAGIGAYRFGRILGDLSFSRITSGSDEMRALLYAALSEHFKTPRKAQGDYHFCVQLPVGLMTAGSIAETKEKINTWVVGEHEWMSWDQKFNLSISSVTVQSQAAGAVYDHMLDLNGTPIDEHVSDLDGAAGIISIGYNTLELMVLEYGKQVHEMTVSDFSGVNSLLRMVDQGQRGLHRTDVMLRNGYLNGELSASFPAWTNQVRARINEFWREQLPNFKSVLMVGGGTLVKNEGNTIKDALRDMFKCKVIVPKDPILSIARGGYKRGVLDESRQAKASG